jgi:hypothetical protein
MLLCASLFVVCLCAGWQVKDADMTLPEAGTARCKTLDEQDSDEEPV